MGFYFALTTKKIPTKLVGIISNQFIFYNLANANLFNNPDSISVNKDTIP